MNFLRRARVLGRLCAFAGIVSAGSLSACGGDNGSTSTGGSGSTTTTTTVGPQAKGAKLRVIHASPDAPSVDVYAKGVDKPLVSKISFGEASEYLEVDAGTYDIELRASPSTAKDPVAYATGPLTLESGDEVSAIAAGRLSGGTDGDKFRVLPLKEGFAPAGSNSAIVRIVHAGADAPSVAIDLGNDGPASPEITGLDRFRDSGAAGIPLTANGAHQIGVVAGGATVTAFTTPLLSEGSKLFVIATGLLGKLPREKDGFALLAVSEKGSLGFVKQNPIVYALHAGPDAPEVDAFAGAAELVDGISFGEISKPVQVPPGKHTIDFYAHEEGSKPSGSPAASASTGELAAGERYLAIATGFLAPGLEPFQLLAFAEGFALDDAENGRLRAVHAAPDAPMVDLGILNAEKIVSPVLVQDVSFKSASDPTGFSTTPGTLPFGVAPAMDAKTVVASFHVPVAAGARAFAIASGALSPANGQSFRLLVVDTTTSPWSAATVSPQPQ